MSPSTSTTSSRPLRLGFVPLVDASPIVVARELGLFQRRGLQVSLSREIGWATVREKLIQGELDAAHSIAGIPLSLGLGLRSPSCDVVVPLVLNLQGLAITLSAEFSPEKVGRGEGLRDYLGRYWKRSRPFTLAVSHPESTHGSLLHSWLTRIGVPKDPPIVIVTLPPYMMPRMLQSRQIDGYCSGEPWNSQAILAGSGWSPIQSADLARNHPGSFLVVRDEVVEERRGEVVRLVSTLLEACERCQDGAFRDELIALLARPESLDVAPEVLRNTLGPVFNSGTGQVSAADFHVFHGRDANRPGMDKASWALAELRKSHTIPQEACGRLSQLFREDLYAEAADTIPPASGNPAMRAGIGSEAPL